MMTLEDCKLVGDALKLGFDSPVMLSKLKTALALFCIDYEKGTNATAQDRNGLIAAIESAGEQQ